MTGNYAGDWLHALTPNIPLHKDGKLPSQPHYHTFIWVIEETGLGECGLRLLFLYVADFRLHKWKKNSSFDELPSSRLDEVRWVEERKEIDFSLPWVNGWGEGGIKGRERQKRKIAECGQKKSWQRTVLGDFGIRWKIRINSRAR